MEKVGTELGEFGVLFYTVHVHCIILMMEMMHSDLIKPLRIPFSRVLMHVRALTFSLFAVGIVASLKRLYMFYKSHSRMLHHGTLLAEPSSDLQ